MLRKHKQLQEAVLEAGWGVGWAEALKPWIICAFLHCAYSSAWGISAPSCYCARTADKSSCRGKDLLQSTVPGSVHRSGKTKATRT